MFYAHASVGTLHVRPIINMKSEQDIKNMRSITEEAFQIVKEYKGAHSGEHGDGILRSEFHEMMFGKKLINWGYPLQAKKEFNPHNQFLQITNEIGFLGLLIFLVLLTNFGLYAIKRKDNFGMLFLMILVVFCLFESVLQRLSGVVFFICWMSALQAYWSSKSKFELL